VPAHIIIVFETRHWTDPSSLERYNILFKKSQLFLQINWECDRQTDRQTDRMTGQIDRRTQRP